VFEETDPKTKFDIRLVTLKGAHTSTPLIQTPFNDQNPALSSDGAWLAYQSDESGRAEVYVCPFPKVDSGRWQVSTAGGTRPLWSRDGRDLFYLDVDRRLTVVSVQTQPTFHVSPPGAPRASVAESPYTDLPIPDSARWPRINELFHAAPSEQNAVAGNTRLSQGCACRAPQWRLCAVRLNTRHLSGQIREVPDYGNRDRAGHGNLEAFTRRMALPIELRLAAGGDHAVDNVIGHPRRSIEETASLAAIRAAIGSSRARPLPGAAAAPRPQSARLCRASCSRGDWNTPVPAKSSGLGRSPQGKR